MTKKLGRTPYKDPRRKIVTKSYYPSEMDVIDVGGVKIASQIATQAVHKEAERIRKQRTI